MNTNVRMKCITLRYRSIKKKSIRHCNSNNAKSNYEGIQNYKF